MTARRSPIRRLAVAAIAGGILLLLTLFAWRAWIPRYRPALRAGEAYGIDVSEHQGRVDWRAVAADGFEYAYVKATEGADHVDDDFSRNWTGAATAGITRGAYHFFSLCSAGDAQARNFLHTVPADPVALPPALDLELSGNCSARPSPGAVKHEILGFLQEVEDATGRTVVLYVGNDFEDRYGVSERFDRPAWERRLVLRPGGDWMVWQVDGVARVDGIGGDVDLDVFRRSITRG